MRATCPSCGSTNDCERTEASHNKAAPYVVCPACENVFVPKTYVTDEKHPRREVLHRATGLPDADVRCARDRLEQYVRKHGEYLDRDRDILLLRIFERIEKIELT